MINSFQLHATYDIHTASSEQHRNVHATPRNKLASVIAVLSSPSRAQAQGCCATPPNHLSTSAAVVPMSSAPYCPYTRARSSMRTHSSLGHAPATLTIYNLWKGVHVQRALCMGLSAHPIPTLSTPAEPSHCLISAGWARAERRPMILAMKRWLPRMMVAGISFNHSFHLKSLTFDRMVGKW